MSSDVDTAAVAALVANRARCAMLDALFDGGERTAGSLAKLARVAPSTASAHLRMLAKGGLVNLDSRGRHQYVRLASPQVAHALEALSTIAPTIASTSLRASDRALALRRARTCYDHLAGALAVALTDALCAGGILTADELQLTPHRARRLQQFGIDIAQLRTASRPLTRVCLDWSEKRPHLAGALGAAVCHQLIARGWIIRMPEPRHRPPHPSRPKAPCPDVQPPPNTRPHLIGATRRRFDRVARQARRQTEDAAGSLPALARAQAEPPTGTLPA